MPNNDLGRFSVRKGQIYELNRNEPWSLKQLNSHIRRAKERVDINEKAGIDTNISRQIKSTLNSALRAKDRYGR